MSSNTESEIDVLRTQSIVMGNNPVEVIPEHDTPTQLSFTADQGHNFHVRTQIDARNPADEPQTERLTVRLRYGDSATGEEIFTTSQEVDFGAGEHKTIDFNTEQMRLSAGGYRLTVEKGDLADEPIEIITTREFTKAVSYIWDLTPDGHYRLVNHEGVEIIRFDPDDGSITAPNDASFGGTVEAESLTAARGGLTIGENHEERISSTASQSDPAAITDSSPPDRVSFSAGPGVDTHVRTEVTLETSESSDVSTTVSATMQRRDSSSYTDILSDEQSVTVPAEGTTTATLFDDPRGLRSAPHQISVSVGSSTVEITQTEEITQGAQFSFRHHRGRLELVDNNDRVIASFSEIDSDSPAFPDGIRTRETRYGRDDRRPEPTTSELDEGEVMTYVSNGGGAGSTGDLIYALNRNGTILTKVLSIADDAT